MVMENEIRLGDIMDKLTPSDRVVIYNAARQVVYRGYAANAVHGTLNPQRRIKKMGLGMETYRATEQMWDWAKTNSLPLGHGEKSIIQIMRYMQLTEEEMLAIRWHMGAFDSTVKGGSYDMNYAFAQSRLAAMLHIADMMATHLDERTEVNE